MSAAAIARLLTAAAAALGSAILVGMTRSVVAFGWMDPAQYYQAARAVVEQGWPAISFEVPTLFPLLPAAACRIFGAGPSQALLTNVLGVWLLAFAVHRLATRLAGHPGAGPLAAMLALFGPLALGLSQDLYIEFTLAAVVAWAWVGWEASAGFTRIAGSIGFGVALFAASLLKTTAVLFFAWPLAAAVLRERIARRGFRAARIALVGVGPLAASWAVFWFLLPAGRGYLTSFGNTTIPWMRLIGPRDLGSLESLAYYPGVLLGDLLGIASVGLLGVGLGWRRLRPGLRGDFLGGLGGALAILTLIPVKEPRHLLPVAGIVAALVAAGGWHLARRGWVAASLALLVGLQAGWLLLPAGSGDTLYLAKGPRTAPSLETFLESRRPRVSLTGGLLPPANHPLVHLYRTSLVLEDVPANLALGIAWRLAPALVLPAPGDAAGRAGVWEEDLPASTFAEPLYYALFNLYNRRCGYGRRERIWSDDELRSGADWWVARTARGGEALGRTRRRVETQGPYRFVEVLELDAAHGLAVFENTEPHRRDLRLVYAERFYRDHIEDPHPRDSLDEVLLDIAVNRAVDGDPEGVRRALTELRRVLGPVSPRAWPRLFFEGRMVALRRMADPLLLGTWDALP